MTMLTGRHTKRSAILALASTQHGLVTRRQMLDLGCTSKEIKGFLGAYELHPVRPGVYRSPAAPPSFEHRALSATLGVAPVVAVTGLAGAHLWRLDVPPPSQIAVASNHRLPPSVARIADGRLRRGLVARDTAVLGGIPVTSIQMTIAEVALELPEAAYTALVDSALSNKRLALTALEHELGRMKAARHPGARALERVLRIWRLRPEMCSIAEVRMLRRLAARGIPLPESQVAVAGPDGQRMILDFAWRDRRVAFEVDGFAFHSDPRRLRLDRDRDVRLQLLGWRLIRVTASASAAEVDSAFMLLHQLLQGS